ncbi:MAG: single-stranded DNA-binding protein [Schaalia hyovaginalis]|uniref:single-stranded DNA-binding protein n=1 Tax=Schaalia hyovaginalis TaxID=29316 RepID=UPI002A91E434|nr:single-stranded DNA-binding protein [Schaalia hyovaginalis]MDY5506206.1 single-stranded DNA-binding protein [Schaalia hyovaginalis]
MSDTTITLRGRVGTELAAHKTASGQVTTRFRLAVTNWFATSNGELVQGRTHWYSVRAWDRLADNALHSIKKGEPVIVVGRPSANAWIDKNGERHAELVITAQSIGHDLANGRAAYARAPRIEIPDVSRETSIASSAPALQMEHGEGSAPAAQTPLALGEELREEAEMGEDDVYEDEAEAEGRIVRDGETRPEGDEDAYGADNPGVFGHRRA